MAISTDTFCGHSPWNKLAAKQACEDFKLMQHSKAQFRSAHGTALSPAGTSRTLVDTFMMGALEWSSTLKNHPDWGSTSAQSCGVQATGSNDVCVVRANTCPVEGRCTILGV